MWMIQEEKEVDDKNFLQNNTVKFLEVSTNASIVSLKEEKGNCLLKKDMEQLNEV